MPGVKEPEDMKRPPLSEGAAKALLGAYAFIATGRGLPAVRSSDSIRIP